MKPMPLVREVDNSVKVAHQQEAEPSSTIVKTGQQHWAYKKAATTMCWTGCNIFIGKKVWNTFAQISLHFGCSGAF